MVPSLLPPQQPPKNFPQTFGTFHVNLSVSVRSWV
jgi:hypothetical protein